LLEPEVVGQIAAGEVVERPLSVVKELVENSIDAGAARVAVRIRGGGLAEIEVADDGTGIAANELPLALRRHATSKLREAAGLFDVRTLGFRGEGLAAIAAVARVAVISRRACDQIASSVEAHGEEIGPVMPVPGPLGTRVVVRDLFGNVPARREYMRGPGTEFARIASWLATLSLAYPEVAISLEHEGKSSFAFPASSDPALRLAHVFGRDAAQRLVRLDAHPPDALAHVEGFVSEPGFDRPDRRMQLLFVNGRLLRTTALSGAWSAAYRSYAMVGRHPFGVLFVDVLPQDVDPNVHPTKSDVRLRYAERVVNAAKIAMHAALQRGAEARVRAAISYAPTIAGDAARPAGDQRPALSVVEPLALPTILRPVAPHVRVLAQVDETFVLATDGRAVVLVDQHAAHERIVYEQLMRNAEGHAPSEPLLVPYTFELPAPEADRLDASLDALAATGLAIERFGERAYRITATPADTTHAGSVRLFDVAGFLEGLTEDVRGLTHDERVWASLACHSVVRAHEPLGFAEMGALLERLPACRNPMHCPHGRPTIVRLEPGELARLFRR
jgi:DNA mismatch repair protein MutL